MRTAPTLAALALAACADPIAPPVPDKLDVLRGPTAISVPGQRYDTISVRLTGTGGESIVGWPVTWSGDGEVVPLDSVTDDVGIARARWTLPRYGSVFGLYFSGPPGHHQLRVDAEGVDHRGMVTEARAFTADRIEATSDWGYGCGLRTDGLWCWGRGSGLGGRNPVRMPLPTTSIPLEFEAGDESFCILDEQRLPWCRRLAASASWLRIPGVPPLHDLTTLAPGWGGGAVCGRALADLRIWCWPQTSADASGPSMLSDRAFASIAGGYRSGCAIDLEGAAWCWGDNESGQLGVGDTRERSGLAPVTGGHRFERVSVGWQLACGSDQDHAIWCWGRTALNTISPAPVRIDLPWARGPDILVGDYMDLYVLNNGRVRVLLRGEESTSLSDGFANYEVADIAGRGAWCIRTTSREVYCGMTVMHGVTDIFFPIDLIPVPDPASQVSP